MQTEIIFTFLALMQNPVCHKLYLEDAPPKLESLVAKEFRASGIKIQVEKYPDQVSMIDGDAVVSFENGQVFLAVYPSPAVPLPLPPSQVHKLALRIVAEMTVQCSDFTRISSTERARRVQETGRRKAERERKNAEGERATAEGKRTEAEGKRTEAEGKRTEAEGERATAEGERATAEGKRTEAEGKRTEAEGKRTEAEGKRTEAEGKRTEAEKDRLEAEEDRLEAEEDRLKAEEDRDGAEQKRASAERSRLKHIPPRPVLIGLGVTTAIGMVASVVGLGLAGVDGKCRGQLDAYIGNVADCPTIWNTAAVGYTMTGTGLTVIFSVNIAGLLFGIGRQ